MVGVVTGRSDSERARPPSGCTARLRLGRRTTLWCVLVANVALVGVLIGVGVAAHSLGVLAEGADYLADAAAIGVSLLAIHLSRRPPTPTHPDGYPKATRFAALVNAGWLLTLSVLVAVAAVERLVTGAREVHGLPVLVVSAVAAAVMLGGALLLGGDLHEDHDPDDEHDEHDDLNVRAVLLDTVADAAAAAAVATTGAVIYVAHGLYWLDPAAALVISVVVGYHATRLLKRIHHALRGWRRAS
jgi:cobalt-zinc-cadmium efflux system protein